MTEVAKLFNNLVQETTLEKDTLVEIAMRHMNAPLTVPAHEKSEGA